LTLLSLRSVRLQDATGQVRYSSSSYSFDAQTLQQDSSRQVGGFGRQGSTGNGTSADLGLLWQPSAASFVNLSLTDLASRLRVDGVSTQQTALSSSTSSLDANGYLEYRPLLSGRYAVADLRLKLGRKGSASLGQRLGGSGGGAWVGLRWERFGGLDLPALWAVLPLAPGWLLQLDRETRFRSLGLGLVWRHGDLMWRTSSLPTARSHALGWRASFRLPW
jgi:hypothetical protein